MTLASSLPKAIPRQQLQVCIVSTIFFHFHLAIHLASGKNPSPAKMDEEERRIFLERERYQIEQIRQLDLEELQVEEVDDLDDSSDDDTDPT